MATVACSLDLDLTSDVSDWECTEPVAEPEFRHLRTIMALEHGKWDPQVGDVEVLAPFALLISRSVWSRLAKLAERLAAEALEAERAMLQRPNLLRRLGLPRPVRGVLASCAKDSSSLKSPRVIRFDFHPTTAGWRISEANADVPGGYTEASHFASLMSQCIPGATPAGNPAQRLVDALVEAAGGAGRIGLLAATGYMEDQQVTAYLSGLLRKRGCGVYRAHPRQIRWLDGIAHLDTAWYRGPLDALLRFYQAEWLGDWLRQEQWTGFFGEGRTPICNPGSALVVESKRFPLVWDALGLELPTWRALLPETRDPREARWRRVPGWVLKTALCNTGDTVAIPGVNPAPEWRRAATSATLRPWHWVAQRRFEVLPIATPRGAMYACLGIYTINGRAEGVYGRIAPRPLIDCRALDIAVLARDEAAGSERLG